MNKIIILTSFFLVFLILSAKKESKCKTNAKTFGEIAVFDFDSKQIVSGYVIPIPPKYD